MLIRNLRPSDLPVVRDLLWQLGYEVGQAEVERRIAQVQSVSEHHAIVAALDGVVVGLLHVYERPALEKPREAIVQALVVDARCRGEGVGQGLMQAAEIWARERGVQSIALHTRVDRERAKVFYRRLGYKAAANSSLMHKNLTTL